MCVTALIIAGAAVLTSGVGMAASISAANANAASAAYQAKLQTKQLDEARRQQEIEAIEQENERTAAFTAARSSALAAIGASGIGEHLSFFQGVDPDQQTRLLRDVRNVRLNLRSETNRIADEIQVTAFGAEMAKFNAGVSKVGAIADFMGTLAQAANFYSSYAASSAKPAPT